MLTLLSFVFVILQHIPKEGNPTQKAYARELLQKLSPTERKFLSCLCKELLFTSTFGYTLFGNKPLSCTSDGSLSVLDHRFFFLKFALPLLSKYEKNLNSQKFLVLLEENQEMPWIYLVNKRDFLRVVRENLTIFQEVLRTDITPEGLLRDIEEKKCTLGSAIQRNHALFGILFGFGTHNALAFDRRSQFENFIHNQGFPPWKDPSQQNLVDMNEVFLLNDNRKDKNRRTMTVTPQGRAFSSDIQTLEQRYAELDKQLGPAGGVCRHCRLASSIMLPCFSGDPENEETVQLVNEYQAVQAQLTQLLNDEKILEKVLEKFFESVGAQ